MYPDNLGIYYGEDTVIWYDEDGIQHVEYLDETDRKELKKFFFKKRWGKLLNRNSENYLYRRKNQ